MNGEIQGFSLSRNGPKITHLFFADDCLLFCRSTLEECKKIQELLSLYEAASGQMLNKNKTTLIFSKNTDEETKKEVMEILGDIQDAQPKKYLGLPSLIIRSKSLQQDKGESGEENVGVERKTPFNWRKRNSD